MKKPVRQVIFPAGIGFLFSFLVIFIVHLFIHFCFPHAADPYVSAFMYPFSFSYSLCPVLYFLHPGYQQYAILSFQRVLIFLCKKDCRWTAFILWIFFVPFQHAVHHAFRQPHFLRYLRGAHPLLCEAADDNRQWFTDFDDMHVRIVKANASLSPVMLLYRMKQFGIRSTV